MKRHMHVFPNPTGSTITDDGKKIENHVVGGINMRDYVAIELFAAMAGNASLAASGVPLDVMRKTAIDQANKFCEDLGEK